MECCEKEQGEGQRGTSVSAHLSSAALDLCGKEDVREIPLSLLEEENGLEIYCKGNKNKVRSKRMWASSRNRVKGEKEGEKNMI